MPARKSKASPSTTPALPKPFATAVMTLGHSTRPIKEFVHILKSHGVKRVADVRTIPRSRHNPQFNRETLAASLRAAGIAYTHLPELGGLRKTSVASPNTGWRNASFRGFADYMQTPEFEAGLARFLTLSKKGPTALMCAEAVPWRCHRSLVADALLARGITAEHIMSATKRYPHKLTPFAKQRGLRITYPPPRTPAVPREGKKRQSARASKRSPRSKTGASSASS